MHLCRICKTRRNKRPLAKNPKNYKKYPTKNRIQIEMKVQMKKMSLNGLKKTNSKTNSTQQIIYKMRITIFRKKIIKTMAMSRSWKISAMSRFCKMTLKIMMTSVN